VTADDMPEGWEDAARAGWDDDPAARVVTVESGWHCKRCGGSRWAGWRAGPAHDGFQRYAQCVPCGLVQDLPSDAAAAPRRGLGEVAYQGYCDASDGKSLFNGDTLPAWGKQAPAIQAAWDSAANAVARVLWGQR
jgi:hypothetical protein